MKRLWSTLNHYKCLLLVTLAVTSLSAEAKKFQVVNLKGEVFSIDQAARTRTVKLGQYLHMGDELLVEDTSTVTLLGPNDLLFHLSGGSQLKFNLEAYELLKGTVWVQDMDKTAGAIIFETSNAEVKVVDGDSIIKYSESNDRTDVFTLSGQSKVSHLFDKMQKETLVDGEFTFLSKENKWLPRRPTIIGKDSFVGLKQQFAGVTPLKRNLDEMYKDRATTNELEQMNRSIASIEENEKDSAPRETKKLESSNRELVVRDHGEYLYIMSKPKKVEKKIVKQKPKKTAKLRVFGQLDQIIPPEVSAPPAVPMPTPAPKVQESRMPASVPDFVESYKPAPSYEGPALESEPMPIGNDPGDTFLQQLQNIEENKTKIY